MVPPMSIKFYVHIRSIDGLGSLSGYLFFQFARRIGLNQLIENVESTCALRRLE